MSVKVLMEKIREKNNPSVLGLDTRLEYVPEYMREDVYSKYGCSLDGAARAIFSLNKEVMDAISDLIPAVKIQTSFYELYGWYGMKAYCKTVHYAKSKGLYVITDTKRNDIATSMDAYASAYLGSVQVRDMEFSPYGADAMTINPYFGGESIEPVLDVINKYDKSVFVTVKTSNPGTQDIQDKLIDGKPLYSHIGKLCEEWGAKTKIEDGYSNVGALVGCTYPKEIAELRKEMPTSFFVVSGYGAQGGSAEDAVGAFDEKGEGAIVNASRAILTAWQKENAPKFVGITARRVVMEMKDRLNRAIKNR